ncbi:MAG: DMT family transporter [Ignavibacteriaceae bacterium]|nr:DMT family transporter [Ignavibacteriaceae bacterium]
MKKYIGEIALFTITIFWGVTFPIIKVALNDVSPMIFISIRFLLAGMLLFPFLGKSLFASDLNLLKGGLFLGFLYFVGFATQTVGLKYTTATKSGFITGTFVVFIPILQLILERKAPSRGNIIGVILVIAGLVLLSSKGETILDIVSELGSSFNIGDFLTLICAIFYALYVVYIDIITKKFDYKALIIIQVLFTGIAGLILTYFFNFTGIEILKYNFTKTVILVILYTSIFSSILATVVQTKYQKTVTPTKAGIIFSLEPIFAAIFAYLIIHEGVSSFGIIGCLFIFTGVLVSELFYRNRETP